MIRFVRAVLRRVVPGDWAEDVLRDLEVAHRRVRMRRGSLAASVWLAWQTTSFVLRFGAERMRDGAGGVGVRVLDAARSDGRLALRSARRSPLFFATVVGTLALGIGANTAIFTMVRTVLLEPLPYPAADRLAVLEPYPWIPATVVAGLEETSSGIEELAGFYPHHFAVTGGDRPLEMAGAVVTPDLLDLLGMEISVGRGFTVDDIRPGAPSVALLSHDASRDLFGRSGTAIGRTVRLDGRPHEVVGVVAADFRQLTPRTDGVQLWKPAALDRLGLDILEEGSPPWAIPVARLAEGGIDEAGTALRDAARRHVEADPETAAARRWRDLGWTPLRAHIVDGTRAPLLLLQVAVALVLLLACANVTNLLLVRRAARGTELAVRTALGASRLRILGHLVCEATLLAGLGGILGLVLGALSLDLLVAVAPPDIPRLDAVGVDGSTVIFAVLLSLAIGLVVAGLPGLFGSPTSPARRLKEGGGATGRSTGRHRLSRALVVTQVSLTLVLLAGAGLLVRSFVALTTEEPGFRTDDIVTVPLSADRDRYDEVRELEAYQRRLLDRIAAVPGVESVALANNLPQRRSSAVRAFVVEGEEEPREAHFAVVSPDYFRTLGIPLERGRALRPSDLRDGPWVAVVDRAMAEAVWPGEDPLGRRFRLEGAERWLTVVGVSADVRGGGLDAVPGPGFHIPFTQRPDDAVELAVGRDMVLLVRAAAARSEGLRDALRDAVWDVNPGQPVPEVASLAWILRESTGPERFRASLTVVFAALALLLATIGIYGVVAQLVGERRHELGVRKALGATAADLVREVLAWGLRLGGVGVVIGSIGILLASPLVAGLLYGVRPTDPATVSAAVAAVLLVTLAACLVPAVRAARVDARVTLADE